ncbi:MAG TPA: hypothetical protein RMH99_05815 [Sandaracinaceae bacterium LLY-WYZ-13_1]|nr:hypothetical protein [Sandaracinaceae bacterium LLY-WYZ-13_1]
MRRGDRRVLVRALRRMPRGLWTALAIGGAFALLHALGVRDWVSVLSGTPVAGVSMARAAFGGALYVALWLAAVVVAPVVALGGLLGALIRRLGRPQRPGPTPGRG